MIDESRHKVEKQQANERQPLLKTAVFDLKGARLVAATGGRREAYRPIEESFALPVLSPIQWSQSLSDHLGICDFYIADLDAISSNSNVVSTESEGLFRHLLQSDKSVIADIGQLPSEEILQRWNAIENDALTALLHHPKFSLVVPTEGVGLKPAAKLLRQLPEELRSRCTLSIDLANALQNPAESLGLDVPYVWFNSEKTFHLPSAINQLKELSELGLQQAIVLNLSDVGAFGCSTGPIVQCLQAECPGIRFFVGGGIRGDDDLQKLVAANAYGVLIGSWNWRQMETMFQST